MTRRRIKVATTHRVRHSLPTTVEVVHRQVADDDRDDIDGIPAVKVASALLAVRDRVLPERLADAADKATARGLMSPKERDRVLEALAQ